MDDIAMGSPLGPAIAVICRVELQQDIIPELPIKLSTWKRYEHDRIAYVKTDAVDYVLSVLHSIH